MLNLLTRLLKGNADAVALCMLVFEWANDYDHLVDGDVPEGHREDVLHRAMWRIATILPQNPFFAAHQAELAVSLANGISTWRISTSLQRMRPVNAHRLAHILRWVPTEFFLHCARIVAGEDWVQQEGPSFWLAMTQDHSFEDFALECGG